MYNACICYNLMNPSNDVHICKPYSMLLISACKGPFKCYVTQMGGSDFLEIKRYEGVMFNVISVTRGWVGVQFP